MSDDLDETATATPALLEDDAGLETLLEHLRSSRGFDFRGYKRASLARRIQRRMGMLEVATYLDYLDFLQVHPDEIPQLFNMVLINVTAFFRDPAAWAALASHLQGMLAARPDDTPIRVWSAGVASGEEAYTLAIVLAELIGLEALGKRVKIYATDVDEDALHQARLATYPARAVEGLPADLLGRYFTASGSMFVVQKDLRRVVLFGRHDLLQDAPISRIDVLVCRNTLMYFNADAQTRVLNNLHFALAPDGVFFLGKAEMLLTHLNLFTPIDLKLRLFARNSRTLRGRERASALETANGVRPHDADESGERLWRAAFESVPVASVVLDLAGQVALVNRRASSLLGLHQKDIGRPFQDLEISYRPVDLRTLIDQTRTSRRVATLKTVERVTPGGERTYFDVEVIPLINGTGLVVGTQLCFVDCSQTQHLQGELKKLGAELEASREELQSTSEELETINEELQSTVEELETTNEELQSTNEELETMNEELQSSNEELQALNDELRLRGAEVQQVNGFLQSILGSLHCGVAVLDSALVVTAWNHRMEDLWGLRAGEVEGQHFLNLDFGLSVDEMRAPLRAVLGDGGDAGSELTLDCVNRRGRPVRCRVSVQPLIVHGERGAILLVEGG